MRTVTLEVPHALRGRGRLRAVLEVRDASEVCTHQFRDPGTVVESPRRQAMGTHQGAVRRRAGVDP